MDSILEADLLRSPDVGSRIDSNGRSYPLISESSKQRLSDSIAELDQVDEKRHIS